VSVLPRSRNVKRRVTAALRTQLLSMQWRDVLFAHWRVEPRVIREHLPAGLRLATYDGSGWLGIVGFEMTDIRPTGLPIGRTFPELNLRTYVTDADTSASGVYFFNLDADDWLGVRLAQSLFKLPYYSAEMQITRNDHRVSLMSRRTESDIPPARFDATYSPLTTPTEVDPNSLEAFLVENYRFYTEGDQIYVGTIQHEPWLLAKATADIRANSLFTASGFAAPDSEPVIHYSPHCTVTAGMIRSVPSHK
jgi:uncharacterized protein YqjF (DUF2071 family)